MREQENGGQEQEVVLMEGGDRDLSPVQVTARCGKRVQALVAKACRWPEAGHGESWVPGDFRILIFETTLAPEAQLYVQFWSEPREAVLCEVSSGHWNPKALPFIPADAKARLEALGFVAGGRAQNYEKIMTVANAGDVGAVARETLRIFCDVLGYRGQTPLVATLTTGTRAERGVVHKSLTPEDVQKILWHYGYGAEKVEGIELPIIRVTRGEVAYEAVLYGKVEDQNLYECIDLRALLGPAGNRHLAYMNAINANHREVKVLAGSDGDAWLVQHVSTIGGITEEHFVALAAQFEEVLRDRRITGFSRRLKKDAAALKRQRRGGKGATSGVDAIH